MKTRILQSFHLFLLVSRYGMSRVRPGGGRLLTRVHKCGDTRPRGGDTRGRRTEKHATTCHMSKNTHPPPHPSNRPPSTIPVWSNDGGCAVVPHLHHQRATTRPRSPSPASSGTAGWPPAASGQTRSEEPSGSSCLFHTTERQRVLQEPLPGPRWANGAGRMTPTHRLFQQSRRPLKRLLQNDYEH